MRILSLTFPELPIALARKAHPHLAERPLALLRGTGPEAVVTAVSPAASRTLHARMLAGDARLLCPGAMFLPDNTAACFDELERLASIIRKYATETVALASSTAIFVDLSPVADERETAERIRTLARSWSGVMVQAGIGNTRDEAMEAAASSRRTITVAEPRLVRSHELRETTGPVSVSATLVGRHGDRKRVLSALRKLAVAVGAYGWDFRELQMTLDNEQATRTIRLRFDNPTDLRRAEDRIWAALGKLPEGSGGRLTIELRRLVPRRAVEPMPTLAKAG